MSEAQATSPAPAPATDDQPNPLEAIEKLETMLDDMGSKLDEFSQNSTKHFDAIERRLEKMGENLKEMERLSENAESAPSAD
ncbi:hypothetical protein H4R34_000332 [Dimargaris verticillata]|uniref:Heat shock factor binding protein 1-domain-containing protein n=1 Tax=Dimargaris verticillata TaxID=2761393 RepID=A0A9W8EC01_9FUNG|nr:hypothetical protein H4R34_000332 [Dimargaris verticillata]